MEHHKALTSDLTTINSNNNNNYHHHHHRQKKETAKQQPLGSLSLSNKRRVKSVSITNPNIQQENISGSVQRHQQRISMKNPLSWKKRWSTWFSSCGTEQSAYVKCNPITISIEKYSSTTNSTLAINPISNDNQEKISSKTSSHQHRHHHQSNDKVNNSNSVIYRDTSNRYSNTFLPSTRYEKGGQHQSQTSIAAIPSTTNTSQHTHQKQQARQLSRSADRLNSKSSRRELRYEEHNDYIPPPPPPPPPLNSIQCHPTIDHYARTLNQSSSYFYSTHRRSQIEVYKLSTEKNRLVLPRPYSSNIPFTYNTTLTNIPITYSYTVDNIPIMSQTSSDNNNNNTYGKLSDCHSPLIPVENSSVKAPRRIETTYSQFPTTTTQQEPVYANTQSLYDNILYPESSSKSKILNRNEKYEQEKKSCASQTQLTWTMATFSSFVDLENQSIIIQQPDPATLYSIVQRPHTEPPPSASSATIELMKATSPSLQYIDDNSTPSHYRYPRTRTPSKTLTIEKRDGSFQTLLTMPPTQAVDSNKQITIHDSTPSPLSTGSSSTDHYHHHHHHHHHHRHRRHKSHSNTSRNNISTRDVGLQVNIQTVKKITFSSQKSDDSSITTSASSPPTVISSRESKSVQTNTEPFITKHDRSTSYERSIPTVISSSSQTLDSSINIEWQTKAAQTLTKSLRDQSIETNNRGLFVCDLSSFLKNGIEEISSSSTTTITKQ
ncbi:unnamed protein product [Rotaria sp. Silwood1]|nr:unnamed protein product [Rotaria sp. Silwood1]CAF3520466.1 unnamed protein product [Rotaria sp. Silwood1]CAF3542483.1 unnamed protein product [Rotaria sp. Silwood1]CAF3583046.1 unnamed protein product [Rotaria sp. Silwood1]CAF4644639.1 unnamed protein product [Rotaria sp. Silwood1]